MLFKSIIALTVLIFATSYRKAPKDKGLSELKWKNRLLFITTTGTLELKQLYQQKKEIQERHLIWFVKNQTGIQTNFTGRLSSKMTADIKGKLTTLGNKGVLLIGKDGEEKMRETNLNLSHIYQKIDAMPMRQKEMRD
ncbi:MAG: DUF4174 domain-containing protein [Lentisphaeria bacterium]|nr:DUF4174 domain-containing protein [Lentisphaeria bacterium]